MNGPTTKDALGQASSPRVTWLMPVLNAMPYLPEALASIAAQTYPQYEILAWDNGSTDGSQHELHRWIPHRIPGRVITDAPLPLGQCRARMVELARTELLAPMDADDVSLPDRLERHVQYLQRHRDIAIVGGAMHKTDVNLQPLTSNAQPVLDDRDVRWMLRFSCPIPQGACMMRRSAVLATGNYHDICPGQDFNLWVRMARQYRMANISHVVLLYRQHQQSVSHQNPEDRTRLDRLAQRRVADDLYPGMSHDNFARLYHTVRQYTSLDVAFADIVRLRRLAVQTAVHFGERRDYFLQAPTYRHQFNNLTTRWLKSRPGVAPLWPVIRVSLRQIARPAQPSTALVHAGV